MTQLVSNQENNRVKKLQIKKGSLLVGLIACLLLTNVATAQNYYLSGSIGLNNPQNSSNIGQLSSNFTTGDVPGFSPPVRVPVGSNLSWDTALSDGETYSLAFGYRFDSYRLELALNRASNKVGNHSNILLGDRNISTVDAGVFIPNSSGVNAPVDRFLSNGGNFQTTSVMLNAYYDFNFGGDLNPYLGVGIGNAEEEVSFTSVSGDILRDEENDFAWQLIAGFQYEVDENVSFFAQYRYFTADEPTFGLAILPATIDLENQFQAVEMGLKFSF